MGLCPEELTLSSGDNPDKGMGEACCTACTQRRLHTVSWLNELPKLFFFFLMMWISCQSEVLAQRPGRPESSVDQHKGSSLGKQHCRLLVRAAWIFGGWKWLFSDTEKCLRWQFYKSLVKLKWPIIGFQVFAGACPFLFSPFPSSPSFFPSEVGGGPQPVFFVLNITFF